MKEVILNLLATMLVLIYVQVIKFQTEERGLYYLFLWDLIFIYVQILRRVVRRVSAEYLQDRNSKDKESSLPPNKNPWFIHAGFQASHGYIGGQTVGVFGFRDRIVEKASSIQIIEQLRFM